MIKHLTLQKMSVRGTSPEEYRQKNERPANAGGRRSFVAHQTGRERMGKQRRNRLGESAPLFEQDGSTRDVDGIYRLPEYPAPFFNF
jgi:hypothetical protein